MLCISIACHLSQEFLNQQYLFLPLHDLSFTQIQMALSLNLQSWSVDVAVFNDRHDFVIADQLFLFPSNFWYHKFTSHGCSSLETCSLKKTFCPASSCDNKTVWFSCDQSFDNGYCYHTIQNSVTFLKIDEKCLELQKLISIFKKVLLLHLFAQI